MPSSWSLVPNWGLIHREVHNVIRVVVDLFAILAKNRQLSDILQFATEPSTCCG